MSFVNDKVQSEGLTFDDVLLLPAYSEVLPREVDITSKFTRNITLNTPIVSAAMDTVTEAELAIAIAREGGIGVIHKNMSIEQQASQVRRVKRDENGMIYDPVTIGKENTVADALRLMRDNKIGGIPVVDGERKLIGIVTNRDLRFQKDMNRLISEVMTSRNLITAEEGITLEEAKATLHKNRIEKLLVVNQAGRLVGLITIKDIEKIIVTYKNRESVPQYAHLASYDEIVANDYNLNIPRYVDTFEEEEQIDIVALSSRIIDINSEIKQKETEFLGLLGELAVTDDTRELIEATKRIFGGGV